MCLIVFAYRAHAQFPLVVAANRDEYYERPTEQAHFWGSKQFEQGKDANDNVFAGKDVQGGGMWMGTTKSGKFAAVTNYRDASEDKDSKEKSRGSLVADFLNSNVQALDFLEQVKSEASLYLGFSLVLGDNTGMYYLSNRGNQQHPPSTVRKLTPGRVYGLSNRLLDDPWPKVLKVKQEFSELMKSIGGLSEEERMDELHSLLKDTGKAPIQKLPTKETGCSEEMEEFLSPIFIESQEYGTRACSALVLTAAAEMTQQKPVCSFAEWSYDKGGDPSGKVAEKFDISSVPGVPVSKPSPSGLRSNLEDLEAKTMVSAKSGPASDLQVLDTNTTAMRANLEMLEAKLAASGTLGTSTTGLTANLEQLDSKALGTVGVASPGDAVLRANLELLETKLATSGTLSTSTADQRAKLEQFESKGLGTVGVTSPGDAVLRANLELLETKLAASGTLSTSTAGLRANLDHLESKALDIVGVATPGDAVLRANLELLETKLAASGTLSTSTAGLRANLEHLESKALGVATPGDAEVRANLEMLESKLAASGTLSTTTACLRAHLEQLESKVVGTVGVADAAPAPGDAVLRANLEMLETKLAAPGTIISSEAGGRSSLENLECKAIGSVKVASPSTGGTAVQSDVYNQIFNLQQEVTISEGKRLGYQLESRMVVGALNSDSHTTPGAYAQVPTEAEQNRRLVGELLRQESTPLDTPLETANLFANIDAANSASDSVGVGLAEAKPVLNNDLEIGVALDPTSKATGISRLDDRAKFHRRAIWITIFMCVLVVVVVVIVVLAAPGNESSAEKEALLAKEPSASPTMAPTAYVVELPEFTLQAMEVPGSPQAQAYMWLINDPMLQEHAEAKLTQRMALATFYYATTGETWAVDTDWMSYGVDECEWYSKFNITGDGEYTPLVGQTVADMGNAEESLCDDQGNYLELVLAGNNLVGTIPNEIVLLPLLGRLDISGNDLAGTLPTELGLMRNLKWLKLSGLDEGDRMSGSIPSEFGLMASLTSWSFYRMDLTGTIPSEVANLVNLQTLVIGSTQITGNIPTEIGRMQALIHFEAHICLLDGSLPPELGLLSNLEILRFTKNSLTGTMPSELGGLTKMQTFYLNYNVLEGTIPTELGRFSNLFDFDVDSNLFTGKIPSEIGLARSLNFLNVGNNLLAGKVPAEIWLLLNLFAVVLGSNDDLVGTIPTEVGLLSDLEFFSIGQTSISGTIPSELGLTIGTEFIICGNANLSGTIPTELAMLRLLAAFEIDGNPLSGTFPYEIANQTRLFALSMNDTMLTGEVPHVLCGIPVLEFDCPDMCGCDCPCDDEVANGSSTMLPSNGNGGG